MIVKGKRKRENGRVSGLRCGYEDNYEVRVGKNIEG